MATNSQLNKQRPADEQFPMLMTKLTLGDFLGKSQKVVEALLAHTRLSEACIQVKGMEPVYVKTTVVELLPHLGD